VKDKETKPAPPVMLMHDNGQAYDVEQVAVAAISPAVLNLIAKRVVIELIGAAAAGLGLKLVSRESDASENGASASSPADP
jgi:hypothetical protein